MSNPRLPFVRQIASDMAGWAFLLCTQKDVRSGRNGDLYIALTLQDRTGFIKGRIFNEVAKLREEFDAGEFVKIQGRTDLFNGRIQLLVEKIRRVNTDQDKLQGFSEDDCVLSSARSLDEMWSELEDLVHHVRDPFVRELLQRIVAEHADKLKIWPAAQTVHHAYRSGFLEHVLSVARSALVLGTSYGANQDLLTAGALLHDIGKLEELDYDLATSYTREGNLVGHVALGAMMVRAVIAKIPDFPDVLRTQIEHLILSHHGHKEFGAPVEPMTIEAMILSAADDLDAKINQAKQALAEDGEGEFTPYHSRLGRVLWRTIGAEGLGLRAKGSGRSLGSGLWTLGVGPARCHAAVLVLAVTLFGATAFAQGTQQPAAEGLSAGERFGKVLLGGAAGLVLHETGHLIANWGFEEKVVVRKVDYKGIPFFALSHAHDLSPRREYVVSSAGFWSQYLYSEQILTHHPNLKDESSPFRKGALTFHVITSAMYSGAAFGKTGPVERDTRGMAESVRMNERWLGVLILAPALLDTYRYFHPDARWAAWTSRGFKMGSVALVLR